MLRDPKAVEIVESVDFDWAKYGRDWGGAVTVLRTAIFDWWVRRVPRRASGGTVIELGTGLNTRFERVDNGPVHWIDLDLPDTIELRRKFFADSGRRRMVAASVLDEDWLPASGQPRGRTSSWPTACWPTCAKKTSRACWPGSPADSPAR